MTHDKEALIALRERVRETNGADREIDAAVLCALLPDTYRPSNDAPIVWEIPPGQTARKLCNGGNLSGSIDAALALVERVLPGADLIMKRGHLGPYSSVDIGKSGRFSRWINWGFVERPDDELPLAILDALLTALIERGDGHLTPPPDSV
jgi:hypothetical protein